PLLSSPTSTTPHDPHSSPTRRSSDLINVARRRRIQAVPGELDTIEHEALLAAHVLREGHAAAVRKLLRLAIDADRHGRMRCRLQDRKSTRLNSSHDQISYAVFCLKKK